MAHCDNTLKPISMVLRTSREAAEFLRITPEALERWRLEGRGPRYLKLGPSKRARVVYLQSDLEEWVMQHTFRSTSEYGTRH